MHTVFTCQSYLKMPGKEKEEVCINCTVNFICYYSLNNLYLWKLFKVQSWVLIFCLKDDTHSNSFYYFYFNS